MAIRKNILVDRGHKSKRGEEGNCYERMSWIRRRNSAVNNLRRIGWECFCRSNVTADATYRAVLRDFCFHSKQNGQKAETNHEQVATDQPRRGSS
jgi:hypothetical protein